MIVVDTSPIGAIAFGQDERREFVDLISAAGTALVSAAALLEATVILHPRQGKRQPGSARLRGPLLLRTP